MGCGKSSVGRRLSELLCCRFMDLDEVIEKAEGRTIPEIFASDGEGAFRRMEADTLHSLVVQPAQCVLALGGGTVMTPECAETVHEKTFCIYLRTEAETLAERLEGEADVRPMLQGAGLHSRIEELMALRAATYEKTAHIIIDTDGQTIDSIAEAILSVL